MKLKLKDDAIVLRGWSCPYCGNPTQLAPDKEVYGRGYGGMVWICRPCGAWVGCHSGTDRALGRVADRTLREMKHLAHKEFDRLWKEGHMTRTEAYAELSERLNLPSWQTHIGMFDVEMCMRAISVAQEMIRMIHTYGKTDRI